MIEGILCFCLSQKGERRAEEGRSWGKGFFCHCLSSWKGLVSPKPGIVLRQRLEAKSLCRSEPVFSVCLSFLSVVKEKQLKILSRGAVSVPVLGPWDPAVWDSLPGCCREGTAGLGMCHLPLGTMPQLRMDFPAVPPHPAFVTGTVGHSDVEGSV